MLYPPPPVHPGTLFGPPACIPAVAAPVPSLADGAEHVELSVRVWMCGGSMEQIPWYVVFRLLQRLPCPCTVRCVYVPV